MKFKDLDLSTTPICDSALQGRRWPKNKYVWVDTARSIEREKLLYRYILEQICLDTRNTRAKRLASSALAFWDQMHEEKQQ